MYGKKGGEGGGKVPCMIWILGEQAAVFLSLFLILRFVCVEERASR